MSWNKGFTKFSHSSVRKISETMRRKKIDNFASWRQRTKKEGLFKNSYPAFRKDGDLAELIGVILGGGYIGAFPRSEVLRIVSNTNNSGFVKRYSSLVNKMFKKMPSISKRRYSNCVNITIYEKYISKRLGIPQGSRKNSKLFAPKWILRNKIYLIRYLRGLYEAEGCFCIHKPTYTYKFIFTNRNESLLENVYLGLRKLGFTPHKSEYKIQLSKREEVYKCKELLRFRKY